MTGKCISSAWGLAAILVRMYDISRDCGKAARFSELQLLQFFLSCQANPVASYTPKPLKMAEGASNTIEGQPKEKEDIQPSDTVSLMRQLIDVLAKQVPRDKPGSSARVSTLNLVHPLHPLRV